MAEIYISPGDDIQHIIDASNTGDALIFNPGIYSLEKTLRFKGNRSYISRIAHQAIITEGSLPISFIRRAILWLKRHVLGKIERPPIIKISPLILIEGENTNIDGFMMVGSGGICMQAIPPKTMQTTSTLGLQNT
jgi:hypothetical protein